MKKRLSVFIYSMSGGGAERIASELLWGLVPHFDIYLVLLKNDIKYQIPKKVKIHIIKSNPFSYKKFCRKENIDVSLSFLTKPNFLSIFSKLIGNNTKIIVSEHCNTLEWYGLVMQKFIGLLYPKADKVICVSKKNEYNLRYYLNVKNTIAIYNPHNINSIKSVPLVLNRDIDYITMGSLTEVKNQSLLIQAFSKLSDKTKNLYILGEGVLRKDLELLIKKMDLTNRVVFLGFKDNPFEYLRRAKTFILSSQQEGLPNALIEAMASGCAIISVDCISGPREILAPNTDYNQQVVNQVECAMFGILVPVNDELNLAKAMTEIDMERYSKLALQRADDFDSTLSIEQYIKVLS